MNKSSNNQNPDAHLHSNSLNLPKNLSPREMSAFAKFIEEARKANISTEFIGSPEGESEKYPQGLTVDGHLRVAGNNYYVDHTVLPLPHSARLPAAIREVESYLTLSLEEICRIHQSSGIVVNVVPQVDKKEKLRKRYYKKVLAVAFLATALNCPISSRELWGDRADDWTSTEIYDFRGSANRVMLGFYSPTPTSYSIINGKWEAESGALGKLVAGAIKKKLGNQLARAKKFGISVALLIDARRSPNPDEPILWFVEPLSVHAMMRDIVATHTEVITRARLLRDSEKIVTVFPQVEGALI